jgi:subfamily B ATP-binding cassette protein HlyB/CyaB
VWVADPAVGFRKMSVEEFERGWSGTCLVFTPGQELVQLETARSPWLRFVSYLQPFRKILLHLFLATFVIQMLGIVPPMIIQNILDGVLVHQNLGLLHLLILGLVISTVFSQIMSTMRAYLSNYMVRNLDFSMMAQFFKHTMSLPYSFFAKRKTGDILARFSENQTIRAFLTESTVTTLLNLLMVFIYFTILFLYNVKLTLLLIGFVIPIIALTVLVTPRIKDYAREVFNASTDAQSFLMEALGGIETIKGMGSERPVRLKWEKKYVKALECSTARILQHPGRPRQPDAEFRHHHRHPVGRRQPGAGARADHRPADGLQCPDGQRAGAADGPGRPVEPHGRRHRRHGAPRRRARHRAGAEAGRPGSRVVLPDLQGELRLERMYFRYGGEDTPWVLEDISIDIKPGELVAIVGRSGSGKTTLAKLLVGFLSADRRQDLRRRLRDERDRQGLLPGPGRLCHAEQPAVFRHDRREHRQRRRQPGPRRIEEVAKMADAHAFIAKLPLGYEQVVGERGVGLSGGQVQRLCIARALYHDPRLLVFDEATSALDTQSESNIMANMEAILAGRTAVIIAHRLSTIMRADKIVVLYEGKIVEQGRHEELLARRGMYYELVQKQLGARMKLFNPAASAARRCRMRPAGKDRDHALDLALGHPASSGPTSRSCCARRIPCATKSCSCRTRSASCRRSQPSAEPAAPSCRPANGARLCWRAASCSKAPSATTPKLLDALEIAEKAAPTDLPVLVDGESGTGKELMAKVIHANGARADKPYISVNCGAIPDSLLESELFGHKKGAFTGAANDRKGKFESAHKGTIFLDEIGELPLPGQVKLLRVLQSHEIQRVGSDETISSMRASSPRPTRTCAS